MKLLSYPQTLEETSNPNHHADVTDVGMAKLLNREPGKQAPELHPGIDYVVKMEVMIG